MIAHLVVAVLLLIADALDGTGLFVGGLFFLIPISVAVFIAIFGSNSDSAASTTTGVRPPTTQGWRRSDS